MLCMLQTFPVTLRPKTDRACLIQNSFLMRGLMVLAGGHAVAACAHRMSPFALLRTFGVFRMMMAQVTTRLSY